MNNTSDPPNDNSQNCIFLNFVFLFSVFTIFVSFAEAGREQLAEKEKKRDIEYTTAPSTRAPPHQASRVAERAATRARPEGPSEESCRSKCRREERMLRAKRASSPERRGEPATAASSEQRSSTEHGFEHLISMFVLKQKRSRAAAAPGHSQNACHSESSLISEELIKQYKQLCFNRSFDRAGCIFLRG